MPSDLFTPEEGAWLRGLSKAYEHITQSGGESAHHIQCLFEAFLRCSPYRHAWNVDHQASEERDRSRVIYTEDFGKVLEVSQRGSYPI
jgi:hypothetical protein